MDFLDEQHRKWVRFLETPEGTTLIKRAAMWTYRKAGGYAFSKSKWPFRCTPLSVPESKFYLATKGLFVDERLLDKQENAKIFPEKIQELQEISSEIWYFMATGLYRPAEKDEDGPAGSDPKVRISKSRFVPWKEETVGWLLSEHGAVNDLSISKVAMFMGHSFLIRIRDAARTGGTTQAIHRTCREALSSKEAKGKVECRVPDKTILKGDPSIKGGSYFAPAGSGLEQWARSVLFNEARYNEWGWIEKYYLKDINTAPVIVEYALFFWDEAKRRLWRKDEDDCLLPVWQFVFYLRTKYDLAQLSHHGQEYMAGRQASNENDEGEDTLENLGDDVAVNSACMDEDRCRELFAKFLKMLDTPAKRAFIQGLSEDRNLGDIRKQLGMTQNAFNSMRKACETALADLVAREPAFFCADEAGERNVMAFLRFLKRELDISKF